MLNVGVMVGEAVGKGTDSGSTGVNSGRVGTGVQVGGQVAVEDGVWTGRPERINSGPIRLKIMLNATMAEIK